MKKILFLLFVVFLIGCQKTSSVNNKEVFTASGVEVISHLVNYKITPTINGVNVADTNNVANWSESSATSPIDGNNNPITNLTSVTITGWNGTNLVISTSNVNGTNSIRFGVGNNGFHFKFFVP